MTKPEDDLRAALRSRAAGGDHMPEFSQIEHRAARRRQTRLAAAGVAVAVVIIGAAVLATRPDRPENVATTPDTTIVDDTTTTTEEHGIVDIDDTTTTEAPRPTTTVAPAPAEPPPGTALWTADDSVGPEGAAKRFARDFLGMTQAGLVVSEFRQGDARSGEVEIKPSDRQGAPETTVLLRQIVGSRWSVIGTAARDIRVSEPATGHVDGTPPVHVSGEGRAFEGHISVEVRTEEEVLGEGFVTAGGGEEYLPFSGDITYRKPQQRISAAVVFLIHSAEDGSVIQASAVPIQVG